VAEDPDNEAELTKIPVYQIIKNIQKGELVKYDHVIIKGDLDFNKLSLTKENEKFLVNFPIEITNSRIEGKVSCENIIFLYSVIFNYTQFSLDANFSKATFKGDAGFARSNFNGVSDFSGSHFEGDTDFVSSHFEGDVHLMGSWFGRDASFCESCFKGYVDFDESRFNGSARFNGSKFSKDTYFSESQFSGHVDLSESQFNGYARFYRSQFSGDANFYKAKFNEDAYFEKTQFSKGASFGNSQFSKDADFCGAKFNGNASFMETQFSRDTYFDKSQFSGNASFMETQFSGGTHFRESRFGRDTDFTESRFSENSDFSGARFSGFVEFIRSQFSGDADFRDAQFGDDADFNLSQFEGDALFENASFKKINGLSLKRSRFQRFYIKYHDIKNALSWDEEAYLSLIESYERLGWFEDADQCYYEYRKLAQSEKGDWYHTDSNNLIDRFIRKLIATIIELYSYPKILVRDLVRLSQIYPFNRIYWFNWSRFLDQISWISCGYGVKVERIIMLIFGSILIFASFYKTFNIIVKTDAPLNSSTSFMDCLYFSTMVLTGLIPGSMNAHGSWMYVVAIEKLLGYLFLALFVTFLAKKFMR
jgi:hypothetical protein